MRSFRLDKLVKDKVFISMQELGQQITYRKLTDEEFLLSLKDKLLEEAKEFDPHDPKAIDELADVLEVVEHIGKVLGHDFATLRKVQSERMKKRGGFKNKIYVERLDLKDNDPWVKYYSAEPDRFPEVNKS